MKTLIIAAGALTAVTLLAAGCGGSGGGTGEAQQAPETVTVEATTEEAPEPTTTEPEVDPVEFEELANAETCLREIQPIVKRLEELNGQLAINITYQEYRRMLGRVSTAYNGINVGALDAGCLDEAAVPAEKALNSYIQAENTWSDCIDDYNCDLDSIDPKLQRNWSASTRTIDRASDYLNELEILVAR